MWEDLVDEPLPEGEPPPWPPRVSADYHVTKHSLPQVNSTEYPGVTADNLLLWHDGEGCSDPRPWRDVTARYLSNLAGRQARASYRAAHRLAFRQAAADWKASVNDLGR